jgi:LacI family transcriptional regulator
LKSKKNGQIKRKITIKDISKETGLSIATISRVINNVNKHYSVKTEKIVREAVKRLNYTPDIIAYGLKKNKTYTIGFIVPELDSYYSEIFLGAQHVALKYGYANFLCNVNYNRKLERMYVGNLLARRVDGVVIATGLLDNKAIKRFTDEGIKVALIESKLKIKDTVLITIDSYKYSKMAVNHLIKNNYKKIAFISAPLEEMSNLNERFLGYMDALKENNLKFDRSLVFINKIIRGEWDLTSSGDFIENIMKEKNHPDALFIISDSIAMVAMQICKKLGFRIPEDVGVVGFDDRRFCKYLDPPLTSIYQPKYEMGYKGTEMLIKIIEGEELLSNTVHLDMKLSIRRSSLRS